MKTLVYLATSIVVLFMLAGTALWYYRYKRNIENPNFMEMENHSDLPTANFKVVWSASGATPLTLFEQGHDNQLTFKEYGANYFSILYGDSLVAQFRQFKHNNWHGHRYMFNIQDLNDSLDIDLQIEGPDSSKVQRTK
ncbi:hypothetical protein [Pontibacter sp. G13]|uniref:hypothetical protein n=1 Tax=Pontibacter sp. G13 TaxID=3074898 RepID=UPI00288A7BC2|nr:hypothetical protein [Pontibacter sp. G13]WNJ17892.1 hypothetical protein RJD25_23815 [Pontibacter sp. G13]